MVKAYSGDGQYYLPARKVEPYRLWFEFLKLAHEDPDIEVDREFYADWGDVENLTFSRWWSGDNWRDLFAIDTSVRIIKPSEKRPKDDPSLLVRVPLGGDPKKSLEDIRQLLEEHEAGVRFDTQPVGRFSLSKNADKGFLNQNTLMSTRVMYRMYAAWLKHSKKDRIRRTQAAASEVYDWATEWNNKIREKGWKRQPTYRPYCFEIWVNGWLRLGKTTKERQRNYDADKSGGDPDTARIQVQRYISRSRKLAANVARGEFPGRY